MIKQNGVFTWTCKCSKKFIKNTALGLGMAKANHLRGHAKRGAKWVRFGNQSPSLFKGQTVQSTAKGETNG